MRYPYHVMPDDEGKGWYVVRRANDANGNVVSGHRTREAARKEAKRLNLDAAFKASDAAIASLGGEKA